MSYFPFCLNACFNQQLSLHLIRSLIPFQAGTFKRSTYAQNLLEIFHEKWKQIWSYLLNLDSFGQKDIFSVFWFKLKLGWPDLPLDPVWGVRGPIIKTSVVDCPKTFASEEDQVPNHFRFSPVATNRVLSDPIPGPIHNYLTLSSGSASNWGGPIINSLK